VVIVQHADIPSTYLHENIYHVQIELGPLPENKPGTDDHKQTTQTSFSNKFKLETVAIKDSNSKHPGLNHKMNIFNLKFALLAMQQTQPGFYLPDPSFRLSMLFVAGSILPVFADEWSK
jgi:hypothetical protein